MLEAVNLSKIYKSKGGNEVKALDNVSVRFPEKGMVFLLGKSGSGKSTLLNVCGGLDSPTNGEIIVKGRSSKDFSQSDFDSYRNTYVGFVFQEYNILNEFSVEDNIALALELQGKPKDRKSINALLEQVDLAGLAKRKPNTLSGGQKQRIAIARALIKSPEIIMADEPTGALDSNTGKQVFETLKKLSQDKLVIVVSHDRDFAEQYGDRIIELKDGEILSDVSKTEEIKTELSENVTIVGSTICVKSGKNLTDSEFDEIKSFLRTSDSNVVISNSEDDITTFKEVARINDDGNQEVFKDTDERAIPKKKYTSQDSKFIRSRLPLRHAFKIGSSSLRTKPFRLFFTIFLCVAAFTLLGVLSTMTLYNSDTTFIQTLKDMSPSYVKLKNDFRYTVKMYKYDELDWEDNQTSSAKFSKEDIQALREQYGQGVFGVSEIDMGSDTSIPLMSQSNYYEGDIRYITSSADVKSIPLAFGTLPTKDNEIAISSYSADAIVACKSIKTDGTTLEVGKAEELIGMKLFVLSDEYVITGIFDSGRIDSKYDVLKDSNFVDEEGLRGFFYADLCEGLQFVAIFNEETHLKIAKKEQSVYNPMENYIYTNAAVAFDNNMANLTYKYSYYYFDINKATDIVYLGDKTTLNDNEVVVDYRTLAELIYLNGLSSLENEAYGKSELANQNLENFKNGIPYEPQYSTLSINFDEYFSKWELCISPNATQEEKENAQAFIPNQSEGLLYELYVEFDRVTSEAYEATAEYEAAQYYRQIYNYLKDNHYFPVEEKEGDFNHTLTANERKEYMNVLVKAYNEHFNVDFTIMLSAVDRDSSQPLYDTRNSLTIVGYAETESGANNNNFYITETVYNKLWKAQRATIAYYNEYLTNYVSSKNNVYYAAFIPYDLSDTSSNNLLAIYKNQEFSEKDTRFYLDGQMFSRLEMVDETIEELSKIFLIIGAVLAVFAALLLSNFISMSISNKKREIGILRAVGARGSDVFRIFFSESFVIALICTGLSIGASIGGCMLLNEEVGSVFGASIFNIGIPSMIIIFAIALLTAIVATFLPVRNAAKKKPVESIRAL